MGDEIKQIPEEQPDRQAQPVDAEQPPHLPFPVVGVGASAGGLEAFSEFLAVMRPDAGIAFVLVQHLPPDRESMMAEILGRKTAMPVIQVEDGMAVEPDHVYVIRPGHVLTIQEGRLRLGPVLGGPRAANRPVDDFFKSLAEEQRERAVCIVMSGMGSNGTAGAQAVKAVGGLCIAQEPDSAQYPSMPRHLIDAGYADYVLRPADIPDVILTYAKSPYATGGREADATQALEREQQQLREVLAVLRTRAKQDFNGYKKSTVLRRIQRRMGLSRVGQLADYARLLRQSPAEVIGLADDLLIHVTGFFRDADAWETLRVRVIAPLVAAREEGASIRAWVTACSSGEEAYSLAMLLVEEADKAGRHLDIKVFATDLANRAIANARAGIYPGGIESEISPERLERFFSWTDELYHVRQELRDRVVFAPQNVLHDPPFSRLDIVTCRNLLIYLDPEVQYRVLHLLHFGLREGGALFLGTSETVSGADDLFDPVDKKARIYRRVGPTRHGAIEFPLPRALRVGDPAVLDRLRPRQSDAIRASIAQLTERALLEHHTPPSVTIDRDNQVLYFHGDTRPYLIQPTGEPTRDLLLLARIGVRGAIRVALQRAAAENGPAIALDGWAGDEPRLRTRVAVTASPISRMGPEDAAGPPEHYVVSFADHGELTPAAPGPDGGESVDGLRRLRSELQSTIEELQTSNEELKASNEEAMSINEELQTSNEELETSKEEMQSLNEELNTLNSQLRAKMEEHQAVSSDLASLLTSTDIAVLFLDRAFRVRRYTPAIANLMDLIEADVGRPLAALARKFDDPDLDDDCRAVLERLVPAEREVAGADGRHYLRRVTPYRTTDVRIEGVVVTFVDITRRRRAEEALRASEAQFRRAIEDAPIPVIMQAENGQVLQISRTWSELTGYALSDVPTAEAWLSLANGQGADEVRGQMQELFGGARKTLHVDFALRARSGAERHWIFSANAPGSLGDGRRFLVGMAVDVTDRRRAEDRIRRMLNIDAVGVIVFDAEATLIEANDAFLKMSGYSHEDVAGGKLTRRRLACPEHLRESERQMARLAETGRIGPYEDEYVRADGSKSWMLFVGASLGDGTVVEYVIDIAEQKQTEEDLRLSEERLRLVVESATDYAIVTLAPDRTVTAWSPGATATFGWSADEMVGRLADEVFSPEDRAAGVPAREAETARRDRRAADERWHLRKDGSRFFASGVLTPLGAGGALGFVKVLRDLSDRKRIEDELRQARDELESRVEERTGELRTTQARALQAERLAAIGQMIAGLAHESRNALQRGQACLWMLAHRLKEQPEALDLVQRIQAAQNDLQRLHEDVREYAAPIRFDPVRCDVAAVWREAWAELNVSRAGRDAKLTEEVDCTNPFCLGSPFHLKQVFRNLLDNALAAATGSLHVRIRCLDGALNEQPALRVEILDNGPGFTTDQRQKAFEPFYTSKIHGTGLGLAICGRIIEAHGGKIEIGAEGEPGGVVILHLPRERHGT